MLYAPCLPNPQSAIRNPQSKIYNLRAACWSSCSLTPSALTPRILRKQDLLIFARITVFNKSSVGRDEGLRELTPWM
jgi:hypothetical protein